MGLLVFCLAQPRLNMINHVPLENSPEVLASKARDIAKTLGYTERPADTASGIRVQSDYLTYMRGKVKGDELARLVSHPPSPLEFWYRQSPRPLVTDDGSGGLVAAHEPVALLPGMIRIDTDLDGRLRRFRATPPEHEADPASKTPADLTPLFSAAGLDPAPLQPAAPEWTALSDTDTRAAWTGSYPGRKDLPIRVEAAAFHGRAVSFEIIWPWTKPSRTPEEEGLASTVQLIIVVLVLIAAAMVARYNWRAKRSDSRSAVRIGLYCAGTSLLTWILSAHHVASSDELTLAYQASRSAAFLFALFLLLYLALEPWVRRYWPQTMITWSRLLAGRWRDPLVGRDILFGAVCGIAYCLLIQGYEWISLHLGNPDFSDFNVSNFMGVRAPAAAISQRLANALTSGLELFMLLFLLRILLRRQWLAALVFVALLVYVDTGSNQYPTTAAMIGATALFVVIYILFVLIMLRLGFFALITTLFVVNGTLSLFLTLDIGQWYGQSSLIVVVLLCALAWWGFHLSLAGRPLFTGPDLASEPRR